MAKTLRLIMGDQLACDVSALEGASENDIIFMCEVSDEATYVRHHKKKIAFLFSAMRHFANGLQENGHTVIYARLDDPQNDAASFTDALEKAIHQQSVSKIVTTEASEWRVQEMQRKWQKTFGIPVEIRPDTRFISTQTEFAAWAKVRKELRMEFFYREMRKKTGYLINQDGEPEGGEWNYDKENRAPPKNNMLFPTRPLFEPDNLTAAVLDLVATRFGNHFGDIEPFNYPVTRKDALIYLDWFLVNALPDFGTYQDAMVQDEPLMYHSHLSGLINCGLLDPRECCEKAEAAFRSGKAPLNAVEGFIRQIIGWREYIRGIYWLKMPEYTKENALKANRNLPDWFWTGETQMNCLRQAITETKQNAYAHHIQRLMVIGNFAALAGLHPEEVQEWYLAVYHDAYEWVEMPNVVGMILYADGGVVASKPYIASGAYISKMSNYCDRCKYSVSKKNGEKACPFNYLYWNFLDLNREHFAGNHRMGMMFATLDKMADDKREAIKLDSERFLRNVNSA